MPAKNTETDAMKGKLNSGETVKDPILNRQDLNSLIKGHSWSLWLAPRHSIVICFASLVVICTSRVISTVNNN